MTGTARAAPAAACVIGWPVAHSRSPLIHIYWLKHYGIAGEYRREAVRREDFAAFAGSLATRGYVMRGGEVRRSGTVAEIKDFALSEEYL